MKIILKCFFRDTDVCDLKLPFPVILVFKQIIPMLFILIPDLEVPQAEYLDSCMDSSCLWAATFYRFFGLHINFCQAIN